MNDGRRRLPLNRDTVNPLLSPSLSNKLPPSNKPPPPFQGKKVNKPSLSIKPPSPPLPHLFFTNK